MFAWNSGGFTVTGHGFYTDNAAVGRQSYAAGGTFVKISFCVFYFGGNGYASANSQGGQGVELISNTFCSTGSSVTQVNNSN